LTKKKELQDLRKEKYLELPKEEQAKLIKKLQYRRER
jgi:hypothetical protein